MSSFLFKNTLSRVSRPTLSKSHLPFQQQQKFKPSQYHHARRFATDTTGPTPAAAPAAIPRPPGVPGPEPIKGRYTTLPCDLFRIMLGPNIRLRDQAFQASKGRLSYDLILHNGLVKPAEGDLFIGPNGASFRPNTYNLQNTVRLFKAPEFQIVKIPEGTKLPSELVALHEHTDHWSVQCAKPMSLPKLNKLVSLLCQKSGTTYTKEQFVELYPYLSARGV